MLTNVITFARRVKRKFTDDDVCKFYIQGFCFMEEFQRTKHNYGDCDKVHDEECKCDPFFPLLDLGMSIAKKGELSASCADRAAWEALPDEEKAKHPYEGELWAWLEKMMGDVRQGSIISLSFAPDLISEGDHRNLKPLTLLCRSKIKRNQERISKTEDIPLLASDQVSPS